MTTSNSYELLNRIELGLNRSCGSLRGEFETYQYQRDRQNGAGAGDDRLQALIGDFVRSSAPRARRNPSSHRRNTRRPHRRSTGR
ncbi:MAG: hypothetical protein U1F68_17435 [Gammaproteobacteria bacterium]